jgi:fatty acid desaturase
MVMRLGWTNWFQLLGWPLLVFSWVFSVQLYVYHYRTTIGPNVRFHARRLSAPGIGWWLLNLNEHDTHHQNPNVVWYALPAASVPLPVEHACNQTHESYWRGLFDQLAGPTLVEAQPSEKTP